MILLIILINNVDDEKSTFIKKIHFLFFSELLKTAKNIKKQREIAKTVNEKNKSTKNVRFCDEKWKNVGEFY